MSHKQTDFKNVQVTATETSPGVFSFDYHPKQVTIKHKDTVINYQLINSPDIVFTRMTISPTPNDQFSTPSLSQSGKLLTLSDANTGPQIFNITLYVIGKGKKEAKFDPEVINQPETTDTGG